MQWGRGGTVARTLAYFLTPPCVAVRIVLDAVLWRGVISSFQRFFSCLHARLSYLHGNPACGCGGCGTVLSAYLTLPYLAALPKSKCCSEFMAGEAITSGIRTVWLMPHG